eukprot:TRINITY_DN7154_c0_g1_i1.p1 TRINITY_DN7154_c0_g1~~TRINITY_DN7154_c0_g1_i1.p1  ORF type:complete len:803 (-),score=141.05 TRINITY_DN7154_c0_g1_i1:671-3079(-)
MLSPRFTYASFPRSGFFRSHTRVGDYEIGPLLGYGSFTKVKLGRNLKSKTLVAAKIYKKKHIDDDINHQLEQECRVLQDFSHPNIVHFIDRIENKRYIYFILDFIDGGDLLDFLQKNAPRGCKVELARYLFQQIVYAVKYCHSKGVVHRDLKLDNVLITSDMRVKLADFGLSEAYQEGTMLSNFCGSLNYAAPEILRGEPYHGRPADVWALGVILYALLEGTFPFPDDTPEMMAEAIVTGAYCSLRSPTTLITSLVGSMFLVDPSERITLDQVCRHTWFVYGTQVNEKRDSHRNATSKPSHFTTYLISKEEELANLHIVDGPQPEAPQSAQPANILPSVIIPSSVSSSVVTAGSQPYQGIDQQAKGQHATVHLPVSQSPAPLASGIEVVSDSLEYTTSSYYGNGYPSSEENVHQVYAMYTPEGEVDVAKASSQTAYFQPNYTSSTNLPIHPQPTVQQSHSTVTQQQDASVASSLATNKIEAALKATADGRERADSRGRGNSLNKSSKPPLPPSQNHPEVLLQTARFGNENFIVIPKSSHKLVGRLKPKFSRREQHMTSTRLRSQPTLQYVHASEEMLQTYSAENLHASLQNLSIVPPRDADFAGMSLLTSSRSSDLQHTLTSMTSSGSDSRSLATSSYSNDSMGMGVGTYISKAALDQANRSQSGGHPHSFDGHTNYMQSGSFSFSNYDYSQENLASSQSISSPQHAFRPRPQSTSFSGLSILDSPRHMSGIASPRVGSMQFVENARTGRLDSPQATQASLSSSQLGALPPSPSYSNVPMQNGDRLLSSTLQKPSYGRQMPR